MKRTSPVSRSGRFAGDPAAAVAQFTESISFDWRLWRHDILGSMAHAEMLHKIGVLKKNELRAIIRGLNKIALEIRADKFKWKRSGLGHFQGRPTVCRPTAPPPTGTNGGLWPENEFQNYGRKNPRDEKSRRENRCT